MSLHTFQPLPLQRRRSHFLTQDGNPAWIKIKNLNYSQMVGREELFDREERVEIGWASCDRACAMAAG